MAEVKINLLKKRRGITESQYIAERRAFIASVIVILVVVLIATVFFVLQILSSRQLDNVEADISAVEEKLIGLNDASIRQLYLKNRLDMVSMFFDSRVEDREALQQVFSLDMPGVVITGASFESEDTVALQLTADSVLALDSAYLYFENEDTYFVESINRGITKNEDNTYTMRLDLTLPTGGNS